MHHPDFNETLLLQLAAHLELRSEHPIAKAFLPHLQGEIQLKDVELVVGNGLQALWWHQAEWLVVFGSAVLVFAM